MPAKYGAKDFPLTRYRDGIKRKMTKIADWENFTGKNEKLDIILLFWCV